MPSSGGFFQTAKKILLRLEDMILVSLLLVMIGMAVLQIFLRNFFDSGIVWGDSLVRVLVLWIGLLGAMVATRSDNHISIDIISRYRPAKIQSKTRLITHVFTAGITALMAWYSLQFVLMEMQDGMIAFSVVPAWICQVIIPFAFAVISLRYLLFAIAFFKGQDR